jgi:hypothetical protein
MQLSPAVPVYFSHTRILPTVALSVESGSISQDHLSIVEVYIMYSST